MIQRVYEQAQKAQCIDQLVVATDDDRILKHVQHFGGTVLLTQTTHQNGTSRCGEVIEQLHDFDVVVNIQGDEPLIQAEQLHTVLGLFEDEQVTIGTLVKRIRDPADVLDPNRIKVVTNRLGTALYFSRSPIPFAKREHLQSAINSGTPYYKHIGIYAWRLSTLQALVRLKPVAIEQAEALEQLRWLYHGYTIQTAETDIETPNVDTPEDLQAVLRAIEDAGESRTFDRTF